MQYTTCTFGPARSCNFKKIKAYETKHNHACFFKSKVIATQTSYKMYKKYMNSKLPNRSKPTQI